MTNNRHKTVHFVKLVSALSIFWSSKHKMNPPLSSSIMCAVSLYGGHLLHWSFLWRRLWRSTFRRNLKMILTELMWGTAVWKILILRWRWNWGQVSQWFSDVQREFQKPEGGDRGANNNKCVCRCGEKDRRRMNKRKQTETWRGVFVLAPFWWCSACSSAAKHGTFSRRSYCVGSVIRDNASLRAFSATFTLQPYFLLLFLYTCVFKFPVRPTTQIRMLTLWFPQRRARPLGSTTLNTRLSWSSHRMYSW